MEFLSLLPIFYIMMKILSIRERRFENLCYYSNLNFLQKDLENYIQKLILHPIFSKDSVLKNFLLLSTDDFKIFQKNQEQKIKEEKNGYFNTSINDINKLYEYAQAYIKTSFSSTLMKNKSYETVEIDVLMEKVKKYDENLAILVSILENVSKIEFSYFHSNNRIIEEDNNNFFDGLEKWNKFLNSEQKLFEVINL